MNRKWKVGLLGAGFIAEAHAEAINAMPNAHLVAVCDRSLAAAERAARDFNIANVFVSLEEMLAMELDVVHVLLPPDCHIDPARQIVASGCHVFLEKPMGLDSVQCQALVDLARENQVRVGVNHNFLFLGSYQKMRQQVADGSLGKLDQVTINWLFPLGQVHHGPFNSWMLRDPENLLFELGPHLLAYMTDLVGSIDRLQVDVFRPIDLPGGNRVYRRWHIHGRAGTTGVDLNLSVTQGFADRSVSIRGHKACARYDYDRDLYYRDETAGFGLLFDSFITASRLARQLLFNATGNLARSAFNILRKTPAAYPFGESIQRSINTFYAALDGVTDPRMDEGFGVRVIAACEQIVNKANFEPIEESGDKWTVLPPLERPRVLVIGGTGFIGRELVRQLTRSGVGVRVVTRGLGSGQIALAGLPVELVQGSLNDEAFLDSAMEGIETLYHLAKAEGNRWEDYYEQDVLITGKIAERAVANNIKRFIYTGTIDSYYSANKNEVITADTPLDPSIERRNLYARSKAGCEALLKEISENQHLPLVIMRPGVVIGPGCPPAHWGVGMFQTETRVRYWGDGRNIIPLVLVEDVASGLLAAMNTPDIDGQTFLLTDDPLMTARDYVDAVSKEAGTKLEAKPSWIWRLYLEDALKEMIKHLIRHPNRRYPSYRDWDSRSHRARYDNSKTKKVLGWQPVGTKQEMIERGIAPAVREFLD